MFSVSPIVIVPPPPKIKERKSKKAECSVIYSRLSELVYAMIGIIIFSFQEVQISPYTLLQALPCNVCCQWTHSSKVQYISFVTVILLLPLLISYDIM